MMKGERQMKLLEAVQIAAFLGISPEEVLAMPATPASPTGRSAARSQAPAPLKPQPLRQQSR
jgi:hypothetical protein